MEVTTDPAEVWLNFIYTPNLIIGTVMILLIIFGLAYPALKALHGNWRSWVLAPGVINVPLTWFQTRHKWPYMLLCFATALTMMLPTIYFEAANDERMRQLWWTLPIFWGPWLAGIVSFLWWPLRATPRWNRDWERRREDESRAIPFTDEEIAAFEAMPADSSLRRRRLRNVRACRLYASGRQNAFVPPWKDRQDQDMTES
ncbi:MAG: hypothetical protein ACTHWW_10915 [Arthrobacter sp.]|uniref:hypothetical protein n=1 Tax=unclassified Arthrobacter TaxID=235627 RepID=UPI00264B060C|nr:hypothetical protein [Micrococcaceae bacterium]MDN5812129.1 hypothetical protein [Micrococcaceae bacterium]MDN5823214.1 hypothetical protein [Micrococcaceae bacterium]MDN5877981.1 hypothetical protein [Micrococcaceae bacterium]MDN5885506.1 hypothetical protein [Micrococcaceae bacterium]